MKNWKENEKNYGTIIFGEIDFGLYQRINESIVEI